MIQKDNQIQVAIVGAGPIGIELAVALQQAEIDYRIFEAHQIGYTFTWWPRETTFFSSPERIAIAGFPLQTTDQRHVTGEEYLAYLREVILQTDVQIQTYEPVQAIEKRNDHFILHTLAKDGPKTYPARFVILATGGMSAPRRLDIPGEDLPHVTHYFDDPHAYFQRRLLVVGGMNSALETALRCWRAGAQVSLSYRRPDFRRDRVKPTLLMDIDNAIREGHIQFLPCTQPVEITPTDVCLANLSRNGQLTGQTQLFRADFVALCTGYVADMHLFESIGVSLAGAEQVPHHDPTTMETNIPGLFVAGTAAAGTQTRFRRFIETSHVHVQRILDTLESRLEAG